MKAQNLIKLSVVAAASLMMSQFALAQGVGNLGSLPTTFGGPNPPIGWAVVGSSGPIPVVLDPTGPQWGKSLTGPNGGPFSYAPTSGTNPSLQLQELLQVAPNSPAWTDWHEDVVGVTVNGTPDPGWVWGNAQILVNGAPPAGLSITGLGTSNISFFFAAAAPGSIVDIRKRLVYNGVAGTVFNGTLAVHEYPTPEPGSLALLGLGSAYLLRRRNGKPAV
jgi:hypothetical protein